MSEMPPDNEVREATNASIRESFLYAQLHVRERDTNEFATPLTVKLGRSFDRWLAKEKADAWDKCLDEIDANYLNLEQARSGNIYRGADDE
jgi:primosomal protein N''